MDIVQFKETLRGTKQSISTECSLRYCIAYITVLNVASGGATVEPPRATAAADVTHLA